MTLSLNGRGIVSINIHTEDTIIALNGEVNMRDPKLATPIPAMVPSMFLTLLYGMAYLPHFFPTNRAVPSPNVKIVMAVYPVSGENNVSETTMLSAKNTGERANSHRSSPVTATSVIWEIIGNRISESLRSSDIKKRSVQKIMISATPFGLTWNTWQMNGIL